MDLIKISAVSYLNTFPFVFGIKTSGELEDVELDLDIPSMCAAKLKAGLVDLALVPVGAIPELSQPLLISDFCIGAVREVRTVILASQVPLNKIREIALDYDSLTSALLAKVLAKHFWKINPRWNPLKQGVAENPSGIDSLVVIGDKTFEIAKQYPYIYDLAEEWITFTSLPFVFAVWMSIRSLPEGFLAKFNLALSYGIEHKEEIPDFFRNRIPAGIDVMSYFDENISFVLDAKKRKGMNLYLNYLREL